MQTKVLILIVAALALAVVLVAVALPAASKDSMSTTDLSAPADLSALTSMIVPKAALMTIANVDVAGGNVTVTVPYTAKVYTVEGVDLAAVASFSKPLQPSFNASTGVGQVAWATALPANATFDTVSNSSIPVAGAKAVVAIQDVNITGMAKDQFTVQFGKVAYYLPDGTVNAIKLDKPVSISYTMEKGKVSVKADPAFTQIIAGLSQLKATFPAGAQPVKLNAILGA